MAENISAKWKIGTPQAPAVFDPPADYKKIVQDIENKVAGGAQLVANAATRLAIPPAELYSGKRVAQLDDRSEWEYTGSAWNQIRGDTGWIALTGFQNSFTARAGFEPRYRVLNGVVYVDGELYRATATTILLAFTMPAGVRPRGLVGSTPVPEWGVNVQFGSSGTVQIAAATARTTSTGYPLAMSYIPA